MSNTHKRDITELRRTVSRRSGATRYPPRASRELIESCCRNGPPIPDDIPEAGSILETAQTAVELESKSLADNWTPSHRHPSPSLRASRKTFHLPPLPPPLSMNRYYLSYIFGETPGAVCRSVRFTILVSRLGLLSFSLPLSLSFSLSLFPSLWHTSLGRKQAEMRAHEEPRASGACCLRFFLFSLLYPYHRVVTIRLDFGC